MRMPADKQSTLILTSNDVADVVSGVGAHRFMDEMIDRLHCAFADFDEEIVKVPVRDGFHYQHPVSGLIEWMPMYRPGSAVLMKMVGYHPCNPMRQGLPTVLSTISQFDATTGCLMAILDGVLLTAIRTGAASAVATRLLASEDSSSLGVIGCGAQAVTQIHAVSRIRSLKSVRFFDTDHSVMESLPERVAAFTHPAVELIPSSIPEVVESSDILCTATSIGVGQGPVFQDYDLPQSVHINAVGSDLAGKTELPLTLLRNSLVCPDFPEQAKIEGECQQLSSEQIGPSLMELVRNEARWSDARRRMTVFDSTGWALEDSVAVELAIEHAISMRIGSRIPIELNNLNPWDPYEGVTRTASVVGSGAEFASGGRAHV